MDKFTKPGRLLKPMVIHCISHQQILNGNYLNPSCISEPLVSIVNFVHSHQLQNHHFGEFWSEIETEHPDLHQHTSVWWLGSSKVLLQFFFFFELGAEIKCFLNENGPQLLLSKTE